MSDFAAKSAHWGCAICASRKRHSAFYLPRWHAIISATVCRAALDSGYNDGVPSAQLTYSVSSCSTTERNVAVKDTNGPFPSLLAHRMCRLRPILGSERISDGRSAADSRWSAERCCKLARATGVSLESKEAHVAPAGGSRRAPSGIDVPMLFLLRLTFWVGLLVALVALAIGPRRLRRGMRRAWAAVWRRRLDPQEILTQVVEQHQQHVKAVRTALAQAETAEAAIRANLSQSEERAATLEAEAKRLTANGDELGARAALYKINLERSAIENFREQLDRQCKMIDDARHRLYSLELQLRQYEVGRSILLSQLAQAEKVEEQYAIVRRFDPFNAVANWQQAEGLVQEKTASARAIERVYADTSELSASNSSSSVDPVMIEAQLAELRTKIGHDPAPTEGDTAPRGRSTKPVKKTKPSISVTNDVGDTCADQHAPTEVETPKHIELKRSDLEKHS